MIDEQTLKSDKTFSKIKWYDNTKYEIDGVIHDRYIRLGSFSISYTGFDSDWSQHIFVLAHKGNEILRTSSWKDNQEREYIWGLFISELFELKNSNGLRSKSAEEALELLSKHIEQQPQK